MLTFDAGSGETCLIRRIRTNSPLQALVTLNDPVYVEAAFALAGRVMKSPNAKSLKAKMTYAFRTCLVRHPSATERARLLSAFDIAHAYWKAHPKAAAQFVAAAGGKNKPAVTVKAIPERAAWTLIGNILLNLDETLTKR